MGHNTLGVIPGTKRWREVVDLLAGRSSNSAIVSASARAAEADMLRGSADPVFVEAVRLLLTIPASARAEDFGQALRDADIPVRDRPGLIDVVLAATERLDGVARNTSPRSDFGELAARALSQTLSSTIGDALPGLFGSTPEDVQLTARKLSYGSGISEFSRRFFSNLVSETLSYWLDRKLATAIKPGGRFDDAAARGAFDRDLGQFSHEATRIIHEFSSGWYGKTFHREGGFSSRDAAIFGGIALKKIVSQLKVRSDA